MDPGIITPVVAQVDTASDAGKAIALGVGAGIGTIGPGIGVGYIFGKVIESVTRQPEMRGEITSMPKIGTAVMPVIPSGIQPLR